MKLVNVVVLIVVAFLTLCVTLPSAEEPVYYRSLPTPGQPPLTGFVSASRHNLPGNLNRERESWVVMGERWAVILIVDFDGMRIVRTYSREGIRWHETKSSPLSIWKFKTSNPILDPDPQLIVDDQKISTVRVGVEYQGKHIRINDQLCTSSGCETRSFVATGDTTVL